MHQWPGLKRKWYHLKVQSHQFTLLKMKGAVREETYNAIIIPVETVLYPQPQILEEDDISVPNEHTQWSRVPRVHKFQWSFDKLSFDWLNRISSLVLPAYNFHRTSISSKIGLEENCTVLQRKSSVGCDERPLECTAAFKERICEVSEAESDKRKPDSAYISMISKLACNSPNNLSRCKETLNFHNFLCAWDSSTKREEIEKQKSPKDDFLSLKELAAQRIYFFFEQKSSEKKRKTSFEYIQQISS